MVFRLLVSSVTFLFQLSFVLSDDQVTCSFSYYYGTGFYKDSQRLYTCNIKNQPIETEGVTIGNAVDTRVESYYIEDNDEVDYLIEDIGEVFPKLVVYRISDCAIRFVGKKHFKGLPELRDIHLRDNIIRDIEVGTFDDSLKLIWVGLKNNKLDQVKDGVFNKLAELETLELQGNRIRFIDPHAFQGLSKLEDLNLMGNDLKLLDSDTFKGLVNLQKIDLASNKLEGINDKLFSTNRDLKTVLLRSNNLKSISYQAFDNSRTLSNIDLRGNSCINKNYRSGFEAMKAAIKETCQNDYPEKELQREMDSLKEREQLQDDGNHHTLYLVVIALLVIVIAVGGFMHLRWRRMADVSSSYRSELI
jgi:hypothetical protein